ncbi:MAG: pyridoxamine 5'-phosphate oxidase family protein [Opitutales bacterium]
MKAVTANDWEEVESAEELREILGPVSERARTKERSALGEIDMQWLAASPFLLMATSDREGRCDVSPKGDPAGFVKVIDERTILVPERLGNRRADSYHNIIQNPHVGLLCFVPGRADTLRINGRVRIVKDGPVFDDLTVKGHRPDLALLIEIEEVFFHCSKAFMRSNLWNAETWKPDELPSVACIAKAFDTTGLSLEELQSYYGESYKKGLYGS